MWNQNVSMPAPSVVATPGWRGRPVVAPPPAAAGGPSSAAASSSTAPAARQRAAPNRRSRTTAAAPPPPAQPIASRNVAAPQVAAAAAAADAGPCAVDLIDWPEGTRPKRGGLSKAALLKLKVADVHRELGRLKQQVPAGASKDELADLLLAAVMAHHTAKAGTSSKQQQQQKQKQQKQEEEVRSIKEKDAAAAGSSAAKPRGRPRTTVASGTTAAPKARRTAAKGADDSAADTSAASGKKRTTKQKDAKEQGEGQTTSQQQQQQQQQQQAPKVAGRKPAAQPAAAETPEERRRRELVLNTVASGSGLDPEKAAAICEASGVKLEDLPPFPDGTRGHCYPSHRLRLPLEEDELVLANNRSMLMVTFVGTSGETVGTERRAPCVALLRGKDVWLFDAGEDTQRQVFEIEHVRPSKVFRIFVSSLRAERILGLPGLICTVGSAREHGHENADIPVHVYGPPGLADFLASVYQVSSTYVEMPILVHEFTPSPPSDDDGPSLFNRRAKIWRQALPPDQLNPQGYINGALEGFMPTQGRATQRKGSRAAGGPLSSDGRAGFMPLPIPSPGDPSARVTPSDMTWTIAADQSAMVTVKLLDPEAPPVFGYSVLEPDRVGSISIPRCDALLVPAGGSYGQLKEGLSVTNMAGVTIPPEMVVGPIKPGRIVAIAPSAADPSKISALAKGADLLIADACSGSAGGAGGDRLEESVVGIARAAAEAGVERLVLTGFRSQPMREYRKLLAAAGGPPPEPDSDDEGAPLADASPTTPNATTSTTQQQQQPLSKEQSDDGSSSSNGSPADAPDIVPESHALAALKAAARRAHPNGAVSMAWDGETFIMEKHDGPDAGPGPGREYYAAMAEDKKTTDCRALVLDPVLAERKRTEAAERAAAQVARGMKRMGPPA